MSMHDAKHFVSSLVCGRQADEVLESLVREVREGLKERSCDAALLFLTEGFESPESFFFPAKFQELTGAGMVLGCYVCGMAAGGREVERQPGAAVLAMHLPGIRMTPFWFPAAEIQSFRTGADLVQALDIYPGEAPKFICLADPMTSDCTRLVHLFNEAYASHPLAGGLASGMLPGGESRLFLNGEEMRQGALGLAFQGPLEFETLVSQGCRPIGVPLAVTRAEENILQELGGRPALEVFGELYRSLPANDQGLARHSLFAGLAMDESRTEFGRGDFLIRNIIGADRASGAMSIGEKLTVGQTLQFHLRDARSSTEELKHLLENLPARDPAVAEGALLVTCSGRGLDFFGEPNHDAGLIQKVRGPLPLAGFFANGEFGPVKGHNFVHGYTSSLTLIR